MARRRRPLNPVVEHRRVLVLQAVAISVIAVVALVLVLLALRMP